MHKKLIPILTVAWLALASSSFVSTARADDKPEAKEAVKKPASDQVPFRGKISSVDKTAKTITLEGKEKGRSIHITAATKIKKAGQPATFEDAKVGEEVGGLAKKTADGKLQGVSLRVGPKPEATKKPAKAKGEKKEKAEK